MPPLPLKRCKCPLWFGFSTIIVLVIIIITTTIATVIITIVITITITITITLQCRRGRRTLMVLDYCYYFCHYYY